MKISGIESIPLSIPLTRPLNITPYMGDKYIQRDRINVILVKLFTDEGLESFGLTFALMNDRQVKSLKASIDDLRDTIMGQDVFRWAQAWQNLWEDTRHMGHQGYGIYAISAIDSALWCLMAKALEMPLARLLGGYREAVPVYASHMLYRDMTLKELEKNASYLAEEGFKIIKMNMGGKPLRVERERLEVIRRTVGEDIDIMIDANWAWTASEAISMGREFESYNIFWLEDPVSSILDDNVDDLVKVSNALDVSVAAGETFCTKHGFRPLLEKRAVDILIVDLMRVGGVTEWMKVAAMAEAWNIPVASHLFHEFSAHLIAAIPNGLIVEYMPWWDDIYQEPPQIKDGFLDIPDKAGLGWELDNEAVRKYEMK